MLAVGALLDLIAKKPLGKSGGSVSALGFSMLALLASVNCH
jgi:hypothetical protein